MSLRAADSNARPLALAEQIEAWLDDVRYRAEQERAHRDVSGPPARLRIAQGRRQVTIVNLFCLTWATASA